MDINDVLAAFQNYLAVQTKVNIRQADSDTQVKASRLAERAQLQEAAEHVGAALDEYISFRVHVELTRMLRDQYERTE